MQEKGIGIKKRLLWHAQIIVSGTPPRHLLANQGQETTSRQAKTTVDEPQQLPAPSGEKSGSSSGVGNEFQADQHETHQMVPVVKQHVTQQGAQVVEEIPAGHQV